MKSDQADTLLSENEETHVGIWRKCSPHEEIFTRDAKFQKEWILWANANVIGPKTARKRILLLGESVARGYLFDPNYTPAIVLDKLLNDTGLIDAEVIDLARTNMKLDELLLLVGQIGVLQSDAIVIFAGNNWDTTLMHSFTEEEAKGIMRQVQEKGHYAMKDILESRMEKLVIQFLSSTSALHPSSQIPVFFIIPEYNLIDWKSSHQEKIIAHLPAAELSDFVEVRKEAHSALQELNLNKAVACAEKMIGVDPSHPEGYEIIAQVMLEKGSFDQARKHLELARDTALFGRNCNKPRIYNIIAETLRTKCPSFGFRVVDLPAIFSDIQEGRLPDSELFLDYCHLTVKGIQIAMAETAVNLLKVMAGINMDRSSLCFEKVSPSDNVSSLAFFCAAVHNAHYGQAYPVIRSLCAKAINTSNAIGPVMRKYADFASRALSTNLCKSHEELIIDDIVNQYEGGTGFLHRKDAKVLDIDLVDAIVDVLDTGNDDLGKHILEVRSKEHGVGSGEKDLLRSFYSTTSYDQFPGIYREYFQSRHTESEFILIVNNPSELKFTITLRTPGRKPGQENIHVKMNDVVIASLPLSDKWVTHNLSVDSALLQKCINKVHILWPYKTPAEQKDLVEGFRYDKASIWDSLYHVFGEIHMFKVKIL